VIAVSADVQARVSALPQRAAAGLVFVAIALVLLAETIAKSDRPSVAAVWGGLALAAYAVGLMCLVGPSQRVDLGLARWMIGPWTLLWYGVVFGIATLTWSQPQTGIAGEIAVSSVLRALWLVAVGVTAWALGYCVGPGQWSRRLAVRGMGALGRRFAAEVRSPAAPWVLYAIGIVTLLTNAVTTNRFGYAGDASSEVSTASGYAGILGALNFCAPLAVAVAAVQVFCERRVAARITLVVLSMAQFALGVMLGNKESYIVTVLAVVIPFCASRRRLPKASLIVILVVFLLVVIPFNQAYRSAARQGSATLTAGQAVAAAPEILWQTVTGQGVVAGLTDSIDYLAQRICEIDGPAIVVQRTPGQFKFQSPLQLLEGPIAGMVPRAIWPGKPIAVPGYLFSQEFYGLPPTLYTSTFATIIGGLYWDGGWIPVIVCMFLVGSLVRLLDDVIDVRANPHGILLMLLLFPSLVRAEYDWQTIIADLPASIFVWLLAVVLTFRTRQQA